MQHDHTTIQLGDPAPSAVRPSAITPELLAHYRHRARELRSIYTLWLLRRLRHRLGDRLTLQRREPPAPAHPRRA